MKLANRIFIIAYGVLMTLTGLSFMCYFTKLLKLESYIFAYDVTATMFFAASIVVSSIMTHRILQALGRLFRMV